MGGWDHDEPPSPREHLAAENQSRQMAMAVRLVERALVGGAWLDVEDLKALHRIAMDGLIDDPGRFRQADVRITGSRHAPPRATDVELLVDEMFTTIATQRRAGARATELAAYALWRCNWIHPFAPDGNGRTARAVAFVLLFSGLRRQPIFRIGKLTWVELLARRRWDYTDALEAADAAWARRGAADVEPLAELIDTCLIDSLR